IGYSLLVVWLLGFLGLFLRNIIAYVQLKKQVEVSIPVEEGVYKADHIYTAFVLGFVRPKVYLPHYISEEQYRYVVAHERVHIRRRDPFFKLIASLLHYFYWWNPFVWMAYYFMERDMEMSCDEAVLKEMGEEKRGEYAEALLELTTAGTNALGMSLCFAESEPKSRIKNIMKYRKPLFAVAAVGALVLCVLFVGLLTTPKAKNEVAAKKGMETGTGTEAVSASGKDMLDAPEEFYGEYLDFYSYQRGDAPFLWNFKQDGTLEVKRWGSYRLCDEDGKRMLYGMPATPAEIQKETDESVTYDLAWEGQGENPVTEHVVYQFVEGEDGFGFSEAGKRKDFQGAYRCMEKNTDTVWQFFNDGTYVMTSKSRYMMDADGEISLEKKPALETGVLQISFLYDFDSAGGKLVACTEGEEANWDAPYVQVKNLLRNGTYHYMGESGTERQNFYIRLNAEEALEGTYSYYCGKGAGVLPDYKKGEDYRYYAENTRNGEGTYTVGNGILTLEENGKERYFKIQGDELIFMEKNEEKTSKNSEIPFIFKDGAVFRYTGSELSGLSKTDWEKMLIKLNNTLYHGSAETVLIGDSGVVEGKIRSSVEEGATPEYNGESNFGGLGDSYTYDDENGEVAVFMGDQEWHVFRKVREKTAAEEKQERTVLDEKANALQFVSYDRVKKQKNGGLSFEKDALIADGSHVLRAVMEAQEDGDTGKETPVLQITFNEEGTERFAEATRKLAETHGEIAIIYRGELLSSPKVQAEITDGRVAVTGGEELTFERLGKIADLLNQ
ncbi:MAG: hypothetical protein IJ733_18300, partial [Lachnospiraceae bacterium]|nr:hypothetical protein [Lachnospiraceae bacterium]